SGTDRVAAAAAQFPDARIVVNIQGDEPEMKPQPLEALVAGMLARPDAEMGTIAVPWPAEVPLSEPGFVKVVVDKGGNALYFSRNPIPHYREAGGARHYLKHVGLYAYRSDFLPRYAAMPQTPLE